MPFVYDGHQKWWHRLHFQRKTQQHYSTTVSNRCKCVYCERLCCYCFGIQFAFCSQITATDQLSKEICNACYESVTKFYFHYEIVKTAQKNQHQFLKMQSTMVMFDQSPQWRFCCQIDLISLFFHNCRQFQSRRLRQKMTIRMWNSCRCQWNRKMFKLAPTRQTKLL